MGHYKDLTETGNRARKDSGTQGRPLVVEIQKFSRGSMPPDTTISLRFRCMFTKSVGIYPRSAPEYFSKSRSAQELSPLLKESLL